MGRLLTLFGSGSLGGGGGAVRDIFAGNRLRTPNTFSAIASTNVYVNTWLCYTPPALTGLRNPRVTFGNFYGSQAGGESSTSLPTFILTASIEYPVGSGTHYQLTFGGSPSVTLAPGDMVESASAPVEIDAGEEYRLKMYQEVQDADGNYNRLVNVFTAPGRNDAIQTFSSPTDRTMGGSVNAVASVNQVYGPLMIRGRPLVPGSANIGIVGDSRGWGTGDNSYPPGGMTVLGDYSSTLSPAAPFINIGGYGWIERAIGGRHPLCNLSIPGRNTLGFDESLTAKQYANWDKAPPTHIILATGVNDLIASGGGAITGAQLIDRLEDYIAFAVSRWGSAVYPCTIPPATASSDNWTTTGNQSFSGAVGGVAVPNWANFTDDTQASGRSYANAAIRGGLAGAAGYFDPSILVEDPGDERLIDVSDGQITSDGLHYANNGQTRMAAAIDPTLFD